MRDRLLAAIAANPEAVENWLVYADWLAEQGDPRGELIHIELASEAGATDPGLVERQREILRDEDALLSPRLRARARHVRLTFERGFIASANVFGSDADPLTTETFAALFADPHACVLRALELGDRANPIGGLRCPSLRELTVRRHVVGGPFAEVFPRLASMQVFSPLQEVVHPALERLVANCPALWRGAFELPSLVELVAGGGEAVRLFAPPAILANPPAKLAKLALRIAATDVRTLRGSRVLAQLRALSLVVDGEAADAVISAGSAFEHLALRFEGYTETAAERDASVARITARFPNAACELAAADDDLPVVAAAPRKPISKRLAPWFRRRNSNDV